MAYGKDGNVLMSITPYQLQTWFGEPYGSTIGKRFVRGVKARRLHYLIDALFAPIDTSYQSFLNGQSKLEGLKFKSWVLLYIVKVMYLKIHYNKEWFRDDLPEDILLSHWKQIRGRVQTHSGALNTRRGKNIKFHNVKLPLPHLLKMTRRFAVVLFPIAEAIHAKYPNMIEEYQASV